MYWRDNSPNESGFKIERQDSDDEWTEIGTTGPNVGHFTSSAIKPCGALFRVRAFNQTGFSGYTEARAGRPRSASLGGGCIFAVPSQQEDLLPSIFISRPVDGGSFKAGTNIQIKAEVFDEDGNGTIAKVEFFDGANKIGESDQAPYTITWADVTAGTHSLTATATDTAGLSTTSSPISITVLPVASGDMLISEFRFRGASAQLDEFVELYNNTDFTISVSTTDGSNGGALVSSDGSVRFTIPNGTVIRARGNYLGVNSSAYSLGSYALGDAEWSTDIADGAGIALFKTANPTNFTVDNRLDAVGFSAGREQDSSRAEV